MQLISSHALKEALPSQGKLEAELKECSSFEDLDEAEKQVDLLQEQLEEQLKLSEK